MRTFLKSPLPLQFQTHTVCRKLQTFHSCCSRVFIRELVSGYELSVLLCTEVNLLNTRQLQHGFKLRAFHHTGSFNVKAALDEMHTVSVLGKDINLPKS